MDYNLSQRRAIAHDQGAAMVLAGPGSGKTAVLIGRIQFLIEEKKIEPGRILVITFTKAAAAQMEARFAGLSRDRTPPVCFGTFHSVFWGFLREKYGYDQSSVLREWEKKRFIEEYLKDTGQGNRIEEEYIEDCLSAITAFTDGNVRNAAFPDIDQMAAFYTRMKEQERKIDFEDMLCKCLRLFKSDAAVLASWRGRFDHILIDEFQDINRIQYEIVELLAYPLNNIFAVGDDDQAIYSFRGSSPRFMLDFPKTHGNASVYQLEANYRCPEIIVKAANSLIMSNVSRYPKKVYSASETVGALTLREYRGQLEESLAIRDKILDLQKNGVPYNEIAVLARTNGMLELIDETLTNAGARTIGFRGSRKGSSAFMETDIEAYARLAAGPPLRKDFLRVMNRPLRYLIRGAVSGEIIDWGEMIRHYGKDSGTLKSLTELIRHLEIIRRLSPELAVSYIRKAVGYDRFLEMYAMELNRDVSAWERALDDMEEEARSYSDLFSWLDRPKGVDRKRADAEAVRLATYHGAKGLEYEVVFMPFLNDGHAPYKKAITVEEIEEERRMAYVGVTRAKKYLALSFVREVNGKPSPPSRFIREIMNAANSCKEKTLDTDSVIRYDNSGDKNGSDTEAIAVI